MGGAPRMHAIACAAYSRCMFSQSKRSPCARRHFGPHHLPFFDIYCKACLKHPGDQETMWYHFVSLGLSAAGCRTVYFCFHVFCVKSPCRTVCISEGRSWICHAGNNSFADFGPSCSEVICTCQFACRFACVLEGCTPMERVLEILGVRSHLICLIQSPDCTI